MGTSAARADTAVPTYPTSAPVMGTDRIRTDRHGRPGRRARHDADVMEMLRQGVPLSLLIDLADPTGPHSYELYELEGQAF